MEETVLQEYDCNPSQKGQPVSLQVQTEFSKGNLLGQFRSLRYLRTAD